MFNSALMQKFTWAYDASSSIAKTDATMRGNGPAAWQARKT
jgi:hypothetical protein